MLSDVIGEEWAKVLQSEFDKEYMQKLAAWLSHHRQASMTKIIYPDKEDTFRALKLCPFDKVKVVIIGKEPYYQGNADGLAFSYKDGIRQGKGIQSLDVILDEIERDCYEGFNVNREYQLDYLAKQGVLLLNSILTVFKGQVDSHKDIGWQRFTSKILGLLIEPLNGISSSKVFMLWGKDAQEIYWNAARQVIYPNNLLVLKAYHPAYDLHKRDQFGNVTVKYPDGFTGCKHFSQANKFLLDNQIGAIDWFPIEKNVDIPVLSDKPPF